MNKIIIGVNSYITIEEADKIINDNYLDTDDEFITWNNLSENNKAVLILRATKLIDIESLKYRGKKVDIAQPMEFPRDVSNDDTLSGIYTNDILNCPDEIKTAIVESAINNYMKNKTEEASLIKKGIQSYKIKDASVSFFNNANSENVTVAGMLSMPKSMWETSFSKYSYICM